jgi:2-polyprenyl-3-methyl-5-hydroxy-6-metoxy-1,4-benzoquinol methylase
MQSPTLSSIIFFMQSTDNYKKHTTGSSLQKLLIDNFYATLFRQVGKLRPESILDVGCGEGFTLQKLMDRGIGKRLEGIEYLDRAIEIGNKIHPELTLKQGNIYDLPYKDNEFDLVLCTEVLEHLEEPEKALKELKRVAKRYCIISVPNEPLFMLGNFLRGKNLARWGNDIEHIQHWTSNQMKKFVGRELKITSVLRPLPWTLIVAEKQ